MNAASPAESHANRGRADALAGGVALVFAGALVFVLGFLFIESQYRPQGSALGTPTRIPACGRTYTGPGAAQTLGEVQAGTIPGYAPQILEPTIGEIPFGGDARQIRTESGQLVCDTLMFLHLGGDVYLPYGLEGDRDVLRRRSLMLAPHVTLSVAV